MYCAGLDPALVGVAITGSLNMATLLQIAIVINFNLENFVS